MSRVTTPPKTKRSIADLLRRLGDIPPERVRIYPPLGTATEKDVLKAKGADGVPCELVDGVLVEKAVGYYESRVAAALIYFLEVFRLQKDLGVASAPDATLRLMSGLVRIPDVAFICWERFPGRKLPAEPIPNLTPDLAVEVLSKSNTQAEMRRKLREYFQAGVRLVWLIDPVSQTAESYTSPERKTRIGPKGSLDGSPVLPGFRLKMKDLFAWVGERNGH